MKLFQRLFIGFVISSLVAACSIPQQKNADRPQPMEKSATFEGHSPNWGAVMEIKPLNTVGKKPMQKLTIIYKGDVKDHVDFKYMLKDKKDLFRLSGNVIVGQNKTMSVSTGAYETEIESLQDDPCELTITWNGKTENIELPVKNQQ